MKEPSISVLLSYMFVFVMKDVRPNHHLRAVSAPRTDPLIRRRFHLSSRAVAASLEDGPAVGLSCCTIEAEVYHRDFLSAISSRVLFSSCPRTRTRTTPPRLSAQHQPHYVTTTMGALNLIPLVILFGVVGAVGWVGYQVRQPLRILATSH
jgi:hypothetical protein